MSNAIWDWISGNVVEAAHGRLSLDRLAKELSEDLGIEADRNAIIVCVKEQFGCAGEMPKFRDFFLGYRMRYGWSGLELKRNLAESEQLQDAIRWAAENVVEDESSELSTGDIWLQLSARFGIDRGMCVKLMKERHGRMVRLDDGTGMRQRGWRGIRLK